MAAYPAFFFLFFLPPPSPLFARFRGEPFVALRTFLPFASFCRGVPFTSASPVVTRVGELL